MTEEEYFIKHYPDSCYGDRPLSPYWDFFQDGVEFGERQSEKKIEELERKLEQTEKDLADYQFNYPTIKELEKENEKLQEELKKWKDEWQEQVQKAIDEGYARTQQTIQLTKAKEIIKKFSEFANLEVEYDPEHPQEHTDLWNELCKQAEQFLEEIE